MMHQADWLVSLPIEGRRYRGEIYPPSTFSTDSYHLSNLQKVVLLRVNIFNFGKLSIIARANAPEKLNGENFAFAHTDDEIMLVGQQGCGSSSTAVNERTD
jgi:hypothetical protein